MIIVKFVRRFSCCFAVVSAIAAALVSPGCNKAPTGPQYNDTTPLTLTTTESSTVAAISRIPDKTVYAKGDSVLIVAVPSAGYSFAGWSGDTESTSDTLRIVMRKSMTIYANFVNSANGKKVFAIATRAQNGTIVLTPSGGAYDSATALNLTARPDYGFTFSGWSGALSGRDTHAVLTVEKNCTVIAAFSADPNAVFVTLRISPAPTHGKITLNPPGVQSGDGYKFKPHSTVIIAAEADPGYQLSQWGGDFSSAGAGAASLSAVMDSNKTVSASFTKLPVGLTWTKQTFQGGTIRSMVWTGSSAGSGAGIFAAVGIGGLILTSPDATTWTLRTSPVATNLYSVAWSGAGFIAVGAAGAVIASADGVTWSSRNSGTTDDLFSVAWTGRQFVAVGGNYTDNASRVVASPDGATWKETNSNWDGIWYSVAWTGKKLIAVGTCTNNVTPYHSVGYSSADGITWTGEDLTHIYWDLRSVVAADSVVVAVGLGIGDGEGAEFAMSINDSTWEYNYLASPGYYWSSAWTGAQLAVVGDNGRIFVSTADDPWYCKPVSSGTSGKLYSVIWTGSRLVAAGENAILTSP